MLEEEVRGRRRGRGRGDRGPSGRGPPAGPGGDGHQDARHWTGSPPPSGSPSAVGPGPDPRVQRRTSSGAAQAGAMGYLVKPFQKADVVPAIELAVARHQERSALEGEVEDPPATPGDADACGSGQGHPDGQVRDEGGRRLPVPPEGRHGRASPHGAGGQAGGGRRGGRLITPRASAGNGTPICGIDGPSRGVERRGNLDGILSVSEHHCLGRAYD